MSWFRERERADGGVFLPPWVRREHLARYEFATRYVGAKDVVDCAGGDGTGTCQYGEAGARRVLAVDLSWAQWLSDSTPSHSAVRYCAGNAQSLPLPGCSADVVVSFETIEHLEIPELFLEEVCRILRQDGLLICSTPDRYVYSPGQGADERPWNRFHLREFTAAEFVDLARQYFGSVDLYGQNPQFNFLCRWLDRLGSALPGHGAVRLRQALKLLRFLFDRLKHHRVESAISGRFYEYLVVICSKPGKLS